MLGMPRLFFFINHGFGYQFLDGVSLIMAKALQFGHDSVRSIFQS
jgi:hypothetical protein